jgi:hypothetical protein
MRGPVQPIPRNPNAEQSRSFISIGWLITDLASYIKEPAVGGCPNSLHSLSYLNPSRHCSQASLPARARRSSCACTRSCSSPAAAHARGPRSHQPLQPGHRRPHARAALEPGPRAGAPTRGTSHQGDARPALVGGLVPRGPDAVRQRALRPPAPVGALPCGQRRLMATRGSARAGCSGPAARPHARARAPALLIRRRPSRCSRGPPRWCARASRTRGMPSRGSTGVPRLHPVTSRTNLWSPSR